MKLLRNSISVKFTLATLLPLVAAITIFWLLGVTIILTRFVSQSQSAVETQLNSANEIMRSELTRLADIIKLAGLSSNLLDEISVRQNKLPVIQLQTVLKNNQLSFLTVVDRYGFVRYRSANQAVEGDSLKSDKLVADALKGISASTLSLLSAEQAARENPFLPQKMIISIKPTLHAPVYNKKVEERGLFMVSAAPVFSSDGSIAGAIYGGILLNENNQLADRITQTVFQSHEASTQIAGTATIFMDDVRIATSVMDSRGERAIGSIMSSEVYSSIVRGKRWSGRAFVIDQWNLSAYQPLRDYKGKLVGALYVGMPEQPYLQLRRKLNLIFSALLIFVTIIGGVLSAFLGSRMAKPVKALEEMARRIAAGEKLPDITVNSRDEIGSLASEFNLMHRRLIEREDEILSLNRNLEEKVQERTRQLKENNQLLLDTQKELVQSEHLAAIGLLASGVAHEINNPLAIIRGNLELIEMEHAQLFEKSEEFGTISRQVSRIGRIVENLRSFSRNNSKQITLFSLSGLLDNIIYQIGHQISLEPFKVIKNYQATENLLEGDEDQLRQVFTNLIVNALQSMENSGVLTIDILLEQCDGTCRIVISDSGKGVEKEHMEKLFTPFYSTKRNGTGLGLSVSYGIVRDHGGEIEVRSKPGEGAQFTVLLPLRQPS